MNWLRVIPAFQLSETVTRGQRGPSRVTSGKGCPLWLLAKRSFPPSPPPAEGRAIIVLAKSWLG